MLIRPDEHSIVRRVKVLNGEELALLDTTGTLTKKYQAQIVPGPVDAELIAAEDTAALSPSTSLGNDRGFDARPSDNPVHGSILPITEIFERLRPLIGTRFRNAGQIQERNRGGALHRLITERLKYRLHSDDGQFPDVRHQLLEVKLQTSPTIDLGVVLPNSSVALDVTKVGDCQPCARDVR
ncbi:MAG: restriction endonuclease, partial [Sphingomonadaceae bacterium]|nr:restriction endonuclease [Sphingomonadaceae bacterium]